MKDSFLMSNREEPRRGNREWNGACANQTQNAEPPGKEPHGNHRPTTLRNERIRGFWFLVAHILLEFPARRVAIAYDDLKGNLWWGGIVNIIVGLIFLPVCMLMGLIQVAIVNAIDLVRVLFSRCFNTLFMFTSANFINPKALAKLLIPSPTSPNQGNNENSMRWLVLPFNNVRPLKRLLSKMEKIRDDSKAS